MLVYDFGIFLEKVPSILSIKPKATTESEGGVVRERRVGGLRDGVDLGGGGECDSQMSAFLTPF